MSNALPLWNTHQLYSQGEIMSLRRSTKLNGRANKLRPNKFTVCFLFGMKAKNEWKEEYCETYKNDIKFKFQVREVL